MENRALSPFMHFGSGEEKRMNRSIMENGKKKLGIIGASYLQAPLILRAKAMGLETHVFAWAAGDAGEKLADHFYPISIVEKEAILAECRKIGIDGICTIASDLAAVTVGYVADKMGLSGNSPECVRRSTNKHAMRRAFEEHGDPSPKSILVESAADLRGVELQYPVIVKPLDRSGSRGITKLESPGKQYPMQTVNGSETAGKGPEQQETEPGGPKAEEKKTREMSAGSQIAQPGTEALAEAIENAKSQGFEKKALVEEFAEGQEYSVEGLSWQGRHRILAVTKKYTTGAPHFIETGHLQPAGLSRETEEEVRKTVLHALDSLKITCGASHSELKIVPNGTIRLIEIGARMGGDFIGSDLVPLSTGVDYVGEVIRCAMGQEPECFRSMPEAPGKCAAVRFIFERKDLYAFHRLKEEHPEYLVREEIQEITDAPVTDSSARFGAFLMAAPEPVDLEPYLPDEE